MYTVGGLSGIEGSAVEPITVGCLWVTMATCNKKDSVLLVCGVSHIFWVQRMTHFHHRALSICSSVCFFLLFFLAKSKLRVKEKNSRLEEKKNKIKPYKSTSFILQLKFLLSIFLEEHGESWSTEWKSLYSSVLPVLCVIAIPFCSSLTTFLWQCNWQASAVKTSNSSFFIWRHFVGFNQGFNWQSGSGWVAPGAGAKRGHWLSWDSHLCSPPPLPSCPSLSTAPFFFQRFFSHLILTLIYSWFHKYLVINQYVYSSTLCFYFIPLYYLLSHRNTLLHTDKRVCWWHYWYNTHNPKYNTFQSLYHHL